MSARVLGLRGSCLASSPLASTASVFASRKASSRCVTCAAGVGGMRCAGMDAREGREVETGGEKERWIGRGVERERGRGWGWGQV